MKVNDFFRNNYSDEPNWEYIETIPMFAALKGCQQNSHWHEEGDVWTHTVNAVRALLGLQQQNVGCGRLLIVTTLCHDLGKAPTAIQNENTGEWTSPNHAVVGERMTRELLQDENPITREHICEIVRHHMKLHYIMDKVSDTARKTAIKNLLAELKFANFDEMLLLNAADDFGSVNEQTWEERRSRLHSIVRLYQDCACKKCKIPPVSEMGRFPVCVMMVGLPGSGKSTMVQKRYGDMVCLSRDIIRAELGFCKEGEKFIGTADQEDEVTKEFNSQLRDCISNSRDIVIDNTNMRKERRMSTLHKVLEEMGAKYLITYHVVNTPMDVCRERRKWEIAGSVFERMWKNFDFPSAVECNNLIYSSGRENEWPFLMYTDFQYYWSPKVTEDCDNVVRTFTFDSLEVEGVLAASNDDNLLYKLDGDVTGSVGFEGCDEQEIKEKFPDLNLSVGEYLNSCFIIVRNDGD